MSETLEEKNKAALIKGFNTLFNERNFAEAEKLWSPDYIQHSGHIPPRKGWPLHARQSVSSRY